MTHFIRTITVFTLLVCTLTAQAGECFYVLVFGAQTVPSNPSYSHSFATFVRASWPGDAPCPDNPALETQTISWLPATLTIRTYALRPECGNNVDLHPTIRWCQCNDMRISLWGAYRICPDLYCRAAKQVELLNSGQVRYKALDTGYQSDNVSNCIHAASSIVSGFRLRVASPGWGETASFAILRRYEPQILDDRQPYPWVGSALGLDEYPIIYRDWQSPYSGAIGPLYRVVGGERNLQATYGPPSR
jgi:hypothetical protein